VDERSYPISDEVAECMGHREAKLLYRVYTRVGAVCERPKKGRRTYFLIHQKNTPPAAITRTIATMNAKTPTSMSTIEEATNAAAAATVMEDRISKMLSMQRTQNDDILRMRFVNRDVPSMTTTTTSSGDATGLHPQQQRHPVHGGVIPVLKDVAPEVGRMSTLFTSSTSHPGGMVGEDDCDDATMIDHGAANARTIIDAMEYHARLATANATPSSYLSSGISITSNASYPTARPSFTTNENTTNMTLMTDGTIAKIPDVAAETMMAMLLMCDNRPSTTMTTPKTKNEMKTTPPVDDDDGDLTRTIVDEQDSHRMRPPSYPLDEDVVDVDDINDNVNENDDHAGGRGMMSRPPGGPPLFDDENEHQRLLRRRDMEDAWMEHERR
jgi:hypothetical protein